jgi:hypothetical protein
MTHGLVKATCLPVHRAGKIARVLRDRVPHIILFLRKAEGESLDAGT